MQMQEGHSAAVAGNDNAAMPSTAGAGACGAGNFGDEETAHIPIWRVIVLGEPNGDWKNRAMVQAADAVCSILQAWLDLHTRHAANRIAQLTTESGTRGYGKDDDVRKLECLTAG